MLPVPIGAALISGGASALGSWFGAEQSAENTAANIHAQQMANERMIGSNEAQARENRSFQRDEASTNRQFQAQMSNSAYQRAVTDMRAAGLNPILAARQGGASTPSGSQPSGAQSSVSAPNMALHNTRSPWEGIGQAVSQAVNTAISAKTYEKMIDEIANIQSDTAKIKAQELLEKQRGETEISETARRRAEATIRENDILPSNLRREEAAAILNGPKWLRDAVVVSGYLGGKVGDTLKAVPVLGSGARQVHDMLPQNIERSTVDTDGKGRDSFERRWRGR